MDEQINILLAKYIAGEASAEESREVRSWIAASAENGEAYIEMYNTWHAALAVSHVKLVDADAAYSRFEATQHNVKAMPASRKLYRMMALAAASVAVIVLVSTWLIGKNKTEQPVVAALQEVNVPVNNKKKLLLPDSTLIWLNAETSLKWDNDFNKKNRTVYLEGEAYFEVAPAKNGLPFIVKTSQYTIRDIGTSFNVKAHTAAATFETVVLEGIVSVKGNFSKDNSITEVRLVKNDVLKVKNSRGKNSSDSLTADNTKPVIEISTFKKPEVYTGWKDDMLVFDDELFPAMVKKLETRYGVHIKFDAAKLAEQRYSGSFNAGMDIENVLKIIGEVTAGMEYQRSGDDIVISIKK